MRRKHVMDRQRWLAVSPYLDQAFDLPRDALEGWLRILESTEPRIAADVRELLDAHTDEAFASFLTGQAASPPVETQYAREGELIGNYRVLRELGRGGMALVYLAERADGHFEQRVALKILRFGADGEEARHHFAQERQILASLNHPTIARLIDGGITPAGLPYLAMEYVEGTRIDHYCDEHRLSIEDRLRLFVKVAEAVGHAHRHLIVHRDLKPSNIVVTREGAVKLLDFGIAKLLEPDAMAHAAPPTRDVIQLMTPEYASPEQVRGEPISTATDIYQLGLLLYELLTGQLPYALRGCKPVDALRLICEASPSRPSAAQSLSRTDVSTARATTPERLARMLRGDLDAIVLMALRKEPERRYASPRRLTEDIDRYLQGLPVSACRGVWAYRAGKFVRRHAAGVALTGFAVCAFVCVIVWYTLQLAQARDSAEREALRARREAETASQVSEFLASVFRGSTSRVAQGDTTARELLDRGAQRIQTELAGQPELQGRLLNVIGDVYVQYELHDKARPLLERALRLNTQLFGEESREVADTRLVLSNMAQNSGDYAEARRLIEEVISTRQRTLGADHVATAHALYELSFTLFRQGQPREAARIAERVRSIYVRTIGENDERTLSALNVLAVSLSDGGEPKKALGYLEELKRTTERVLGKEHRHYGRALVNFASTKLELADFDGVEPSIRQALTIFERIYGPDHSTVTVCLINLGMLLFETGRLAEAQSTFERAIATQRKVSGPGHEFEAFSRHRLGRIARARGDFKGALAHLRAALDIHREALGTSHWRYASALHEYGEVQTAMGDYNGAAASLREGVATIRRSRPSMHFDIGIALVGQGVLLARTGKPVEAEATVLEAISLYRNALPPQHPLLAAAHSALGESLLEQGRLAEAEQLLLSSDKRLEDARCYEKRLSLQRLIKLYETKGNAQAAQRYRKELQAFEQRVRTA
jgi:serine/threonine-protein kinase